MPNGGPDLRTGSGAHTSLGPIKQIDAGDLSVGCAEFGPATGAPELLLHGWPYDACSYIDVAPELGSAGYRVIVPFLRGYGPTTFRSPSTVRNVQQPTVAQYVVALMDALKIDAIYDPPSIAVPTIAIGSDFDGTAKDDSPYRTMFTGRYDHRIFNGIGHNVPQEAPQTFARAVTDAAYL